MFVYPYKTFTLGDMHMAHALSMGSESISSYLQLHYISKISVGFGLICCAAVAEMASQIFFKDLPGIIKNRDNHDPETLKKHRYNLSVNLGGSIFYGLCALNYIPATAIIGASIFLIYSTVVCKEKDAYQTSKCLGNFIRICGKDIAWPVLKKIGSITIDILTVAERVLSTVGRGIGHVFTAIGKVLAYIPLPNHPIWLGAATMGVAIAIYKFAPMII